jgi:hypothetical protein
MQTWRKVDESNAYRSSRCPGFQDQLRAIQQYLPHGAQYGESNPLALASALVWYARWDLNPQKAALDVGSYMKLWMADAFFGGRPLAAAIRD